MLFIVGKRTQTAAQTPDKNKKKTYDDDGKSDDYEYMDQREGR